MRMFGSLVAGILFTATSTVAFAETSAGVVERFDNHLHSMTLATGETFEIPDEAMVTDVSTGDYVLVEWHLNGNEAIATAVIEPFKADGY